MIIKKKKLKVELRAERKSRHAGSNEVFFTVLIDGGTGGGGGWRETAPVSSSCLVRKFVAEQRPGDILSVSRDVLQPRASSG